MPWGESEREKTKRDCVYFLVDFRHKQHSHLILKNLLEILQV